MNILLRQTKLFEWVIKQHGDQVRKDGEPYGYHLLRVGIAAQNSKVPLGLEIGFCHDLIEDTQVDEDNLGYNLGLIGYNKGDTLFITNSVIDLTDEYTYDSYPNFNREKRKQLEAERLWGISPHSQTVKYCDLIDNTSSIVRVQPDFAITYLKEKKRILEGMTKGDKIKWEEAWSAMIKGEEELLQLSLK